MATNQLNRSYFFALDTRQGWNVTSFFSFWNDFYRSDENAKYAEFTIILILSIISIVVNIFFITMYSIKKGLRSNQNKYVLAILLVNISYIPICLLAGSTRLTGQGWTFGDFGCKMMQYSTVSPAFVKICLMAVISIDRYIKVVKGRHVNKRWTIAILLLTVLLPSACTAAMAFPNSFTQLIHDNGENFTICTTVFKYDPNIRVSLAFFATLLVLYFIFPSIIITICYTKIMRAINDSAKSLSRHASIIKSSNPKANAHNKRTTSILIAIVVLFLLMWIPLFFALAFVTLDMVLETYKMSSRYFIAITCLLILNAIVEPFLYLFTSSYVRKEIFNTFNIKERSKSSIENTLQTYSTSSKQME